MTRIQKRNLAQFQQMLKNESLDPVFEFSKVWAVLLALCVHAITLGFVILGGYLVYVAVHLQGASLVGILLCGLLCLAIAWYITPRNPPIKADKILSRKTYPTLYRISNRVAHQLDVRLVEGIVVTPYFNAFISKVGWKGKTYLYLGVPLWLSLNDQEKIALIAHELSHEANGDFGNSFLVGRAIQSLTKWYSALNPPIVIRGSHNFFTMIFSGIVYAVFVALRWQLFNESRRAEYLADWLAAEVSGTDSMVAILTKLNFSDEFPQFVKRMMAMRRNDHLLEKFRDYIANASPEKHESLSAERHAREALHDLTHPPLEFRIEFLNSRFVAEPKVQMTGEESAVLQRETIPIQSAVEDLLVKLDPNAFILR